jgi:adenylate cyclase
MRGPLPTVLEEGLVLRRRLEGAAAALDFPILVELREDGATDYIAMPLTFSHGRRAAITFATDRPGARSAWCSSISTCFPT